MEHQLLWLNWASEELIHWIDLEPAGTGVRLNDGRVDPAGRFVVGSMFEDPDAGRFEGTLHQVEPDGSTVTLLRDIAVSNGNAFDPVHGKAYFADSPSGNVWSWDYDPASAARTGERLLFDYQSVPGAPDGGTTDSHGCYWSASVFGWAVIRLTPDGRIDRRIEVPVERPTMPCFGGPDLSTMFVTSIGGPDTSAPPPGITPVEPGSLLSLDPGVTGIAEPVVAGPNR
jgi:sugar lactone lactonase YvrE